MIALCYKAKKSSFRGLHHNNHAPFKSGFIALLTEGYFPSPAAVTTQSSWRSFDGQVCIFINASILYPAADLHIWSNQMDSGQGGRAVLFFMLCYFQPLESGRVQNQVASTWYFAGKFLGADLFRDVTECHTREAEHRRDLFRSHLFVL